MTLRTRTRPEPRPAVASRRSRFRATLLATALAAGALVGGAGPALAEDDLQVIDPNQQQGTGRVVLTAGHADFGPTFGTGAWALQIHDDTSVPRYWRNPEDVVLQVLDEAILTVPDDEAFAFLGLAPGSPVHVVPQTEQPGVVWVGWNTQEPNLLDSLALGATLRIHALQGPGDVVAYLQGGNFGAPQPLWSSHEPFPQEAWIEVNTHTHANWVFSAPGVYLVDAEFTGDLITGEAFRARGTLRFAVGSATDPAEAFAAELAPGADAGTEEADEAPGSGMTGGEDAPGPDEAAADPGILLWALVSGGAALLVVAVLAVTLTSARARRRARAESAARRNGEDAPGDPGRSRAGDGRGEHEDSGNGPRDGSGHGADAGGAR